MFNSIFNLIEQFYQFITCKIYSFLILLLSQLKGISIGSGCSFYGWTKFKHGNKDSIQIGNNCTFRSKHTSNLIGINRPCIFSSIGMNGSRLVVGNGCGFSGTVVGCFSEIIIGDNVKCGANTLITDSDWHLDDPRAGIPSPINIGKNVWLGVNVTVLKGVTIGENTVIGANSLVVKNIPANVIAAGNPCKMLKKIDIVSPLKLNSTV
jgi:acetyltransferase-like isoleucine patch superfamily enzyme